MNSLVNFVLAFAINALWVLPLLALAAEVTARVHRDLRACNVYRIWLACFVLALAIPVLPFFAPFHVGVRSAGAAAQPMVAPSIAQPGVHSDNPQILSRLGAVTSATGLLMHLSALFPTLFFIYLASVLFAWLRLTWGLWQTSRLLHKTVAAVLPPEWEKRWQSSLSAFGQKPIRLLLSTKIPSPATVNWPRPTVILPAELLDVDGAQVTAAFCHELAHVRRRDFAVNLLCEFFGALIFFHPAWHWVRAKLARTRELACDDLAAEAMSGRQIYAQNLLRLAKKLQASAGTQPQSYALGIFEGEMLEQRIMNLTEKRTQSPRMRKWLAAIAGTSMLLGSGMAAVSFGMTPLAAEASSRTDRAPAGWFKAGSKPQSYRTGVDHAVRHDGQPSAYVQSVEPVSNGFGTLMQSLSAAKYAGKRIRLRAWVKAQDVADWAGVWMRVDKGENMGVAFDNMENRPIKGTQSWKRCDVVLNVPDDATGISFGILLSGTGEVWISQATFEEVDKNVAVTGSKPSHVSDTPVNLSFTQ